MNIQEIYQQVESDPSLLSTINIDELLENIESETTEYLEGQTLKTITNTIRQVLLNSGIIENLSSIYDKLIGYRHVERICEIRLGVYVRWISINTEKDPTKKNNIYLKPGGTVISIKICEEGVQVVCKTAFGRHVSFRFDECILFQKLTVEEQLILMAYDYIQNSDSAETI